MNEYSKLDRFMQRAEKLYEEKIERLEQENEKLKEENYGLNQELLGYKKGVQASEIIELKQILEEIREIQTTCLEFKTCNKCKFYEKCNKDIENYILNKINEVLK